MPLLWMLSFGFLLQCLFTLRVPVPGANAATYRLNARSISVRDTCDNVHMRYDTQESVCCDNRLHRGPRLECCGRQTFNPASATCCLGRHGKGKISEGLSQRVSACCGLDAYDPLNQICCDGSNIVAKTGPKANCCGRVAYDEVTHICCNQTISPRAFANSRCCRSRQFHSESECCCWENAEPSVQPKSSRCCQRELSRARVPAGRGHSVTDIGPEPSCTVPDSSLCGSTCYNPATHHCCSSHASHGQGQWPPPTPYDPTTHICCDGSVSARYPWTDQCCGRLAYGRAQAGVLCCGGVLHKGRAEDEECSDTGFPYNPAHWTVCSGNFHPSPGLHCCGTASYLPQTEICCNGHRFPKTQNSQCCGTRAYDANDPHMKCCAGTLHTVGTEPGNVRCCGSVVMSDLDVCCSSEEEELLYTWRVGFRCCGHSYYDPALWRCCAGGLRPATNSLQGHSNALTEYSFLSVSRMDEQSLCNGVLMGILERVTTQEVVLSSPLELNGRNNVITPLPSPYILKINDRCDLPTLTPGATYLFNEERLLFSSHHSVLELFHSITTKCSLSSNTVQTRGHYPFGN